MAKSNSDKSAVVKALENTAAYYKNNAGKSTAWDKIKNYVNTGKQYQVQAIEAMPTYYADRLDEIERTKQNKIIVPEKSAPQPDALDNMNYSGDPKLNAYLQEIKAKADKAVSDPRPAEKPAIYDEVKNFVNTGRQYQTQAIEDRTAYYKDLAENSPRVTLGSMSPTGDPDIDSYLQKINSDGYEAVKESRSVEKPVLLDEIKNFINTGRQYQSKAIEDAAEYYKDNIGYSNDGTGKWVKAGAFEDGWQLGDGIKTTVATLADGTRKMKAGVYGLGEKAADTVLMFSPLLYSGLQPSDERSVYPSYSYDPEKRERDKRLYAEWVADDLYDEEEFGKTIYADRLMERLGIDVERDSMLGEKAKDFSYRAGQEAAIYALDMAGIPRWVTKGVAVFAEEAEHALRSGADYDEALESALIHAGAEVAAAALSGKAEKVKKLKIKNKAIGDYLDEIIDNIFLKNMPEDVSRSCLESMLKFGVTFGHEGFESTLIWAVGKFAESITYLDDKTFGELVGSKEALGEMVEEFLTGYLLSFSENRQSN